MPCHYERHGQAYGVLRTHPHISPRATPEALRTVESFRRHVGAILTQLSVLSCTYESSDRRFHQYSCGCESDDDAYESYNTEPQTEGN
jgi:hypothetical protein